MLSLCELDFTNIPLLKAIYNEYNLNKFKRLQFHKNDICIMIDFNRIHNFIDFKLHMNNINSKCSFKFLHILNILNNLNRNIIIHEYDFINLTQLFLNVDINYFETELSDYDYEKFDILKNIISKNSRFFYKSMIFHKNEYINNISLNIINYISFDNAIRYLKLFDFNLEKVIENAKLKAIRNL